MLFINLSVLSRSHARRGCSARCRRSSLHPSYMNIYEPSARR